MSRPFLIVCACILTLSGLQARAVEYQLPDLDGNMRSLEQYRGQWLVVNYWASWCKTCRLEFADLNAVHDGDDDIVVIGINFESISMDDVQDFVARQNIRYPVWLSEPMPLTPLGQVPALPTTYIIDPDGKPVAGQVGLVSQQQLEDYIAEKRKVSGRHD